MIKRVVISGSRYFNDYDFFCEKADCCLSKIKGKIILLSGHSSGVDKMAEKYGEEKGYEVEIYPAEWDKYGRAAGPIRNKKMAENADYVIAFSSGGKGTESMIEAAKAKGIPVEVFYIKA